MENWNDRTIKLIGEDNYKKISTINVIVFGVGGVGGFAIEGLVRAGVQNITIVDNDVVSTSNINRQIIATISSIGKNKVDVMKQRLLDINPMANVRALKVFVTPDNIHDFDLKKYDYVLDCIDNVTAKISLSKFAYDNNIKLISCLGTGNKLHPELFEICDIYKTSVCPLAKVIRKELSKLNIKKLTVLYSKEQPTAFKKSRIPASISFTPSIAGLRLAEYVINDIIE